MQRRNKNALVAASVAALFALSACSGGGGGEASSDWKFPEETPTANIQVMSHLTLDQIQPALDAFHDAYPTIKVEWEQVPFNDLNSIIEARMAGKDPSPDVFWADMPRIPAISARGYAVDLTEQFAPFKEVWDEASYLGASSEGKLYAAPIANSTQLLFYNKDLLDQAGLEYPSADPDSRITWEETLAAALKAKEAGAENGFIFGQVDRYYQLQALPMSLGGSAGGTGDGNLTPDLLSDPWIKSMQFYQDLFEQGASPRGVAPEQSGAEFLSGNTAYFVQGPWNIPAMQDATFNWGVALHPYFEGGEPVTATGSWAVAMSPFADQKEAAAIFMKWLSVDNGGEYTRTIAEPELPATPEAKVVYFERDIFNSEEGAKAAKIIEFETANTAANRLATVGFVEFEEVLGRAFSDIANGTDPKTALETATTELETVWAPYKK